MSTEGTGERSYAKKEYLQSQEYYEKGIALLEESRRLSVVRFQNPVYGRLYADLGDIYYFAAGDLERALNMYNKAEGRGGITPRMWITKKGYIYYTGEGVQGLAPFSDFLTIAGRAFFQQTQNLIFWQTGQKPLVL